MSGAHQGRGNPTLDVSTRLILGLPPLGGQATGYTFQGRCCLHPQQPVHRCDKGGEVSKFLEASLQIHLLLPLFSLVGALLRWFFLGRHTLSTNFTIYITFLSQYCIILNHPVIGSIIIKHFRNKLSSLPSYVFCRHLLYLHRVYSTLFLHIAYL